MKKTLVRQYPTKSLFLNSVKPTVEIVAGGRYWIGASTSPKFVIVTRREGPFVWYVQHPYKDEIREQVSIFRILATSGCEMELKNMSRPEADWFVGKPQWAHEREAYLRKVLAGELPEPVNYEDFQRVYVYFRASEEISVNDAWDKLEAALRYSVCGQAHRTLEISTDRKMARDLMAEKVAGFTFVRMSEEAWLVDEEVAA